LTGSWTFQNTYVWITSRPPSLALAMSVGHICQFFAEIWRINHGIDRMECIRKLSFLGIRKMLLKVSIMMIIERSHHFFVHVAGISSDSILRSSTARKS
jgi:hypothetical protein